MIIPLPTLSDVPQAIQLALGPAFLLTAIAGLLNVMAGRLARIIDRGRSLTEGAPLPDPLPEALQRELAVLDRRRHLASAAIAGCTLAALLVCTVIAALFVEALVRVSLKWPAGLLFTAATLALVVGLGYFLREVNLATATVRIRATPRRGEPPR